MTFTKFVVDTKPSANGTGFSCTLARPRGVVAKLNFTVKLTVAKELGWGDGDALEVMLGSGEDHGYVRVRKNASVGTAVLKKRTAKETDYLAFSLGHVPAFVNESRDRRWVNFELLADGWLQVLLPSWADETAPDETPVRNRPAVGAAVAARPVGPNGSAIVARLAGDPAPGRSALDARKLAEAAVAMRGGKGKRK